MAPVAVQAQPARPAGPAGPLRLVGSDLQTPDPTSIESDQQALARLLEAYYTSYYRDELGLPDWKSHVAKRRSEEDNFAAILAKAEREVIGRTIGPCIGRPPPRVLVVGGGTGADFITFARRGCDVHAVEPNSDAVEIVRLKGRTLAIDTTNFIRGVGERLPYANESFDFIWSWTVIEHVQNVRATLSEMARVLRPGGEMFIGTVDYRQNYEPHYKTCLPCFLPESLVKIILRARGRPPAFYSTLARTNVHEVGTIFRDLGVIALHAHYPWSKMEASPRTLGERLVARIARRRLIHTNQHWLVRKPA